MYSTEEIKKKNIQKARQIMELTGEKSVTNAISVEEFNSTYAEGYQVIDDLGVMKYKYNVQKAISESPENEDKFKAESEEVLKGFSKVVVKNDTNVKDFYVKKISE